jgi:hypothetical protein
MADRGKEDTKMYEKRGLVYTALDDKGNKIGTPIKASDFYSKPTLKYLEQKFVQNESLRHMHQRKLKVDIQLVLLREKPTLEEFKKALAAQGVDVVLRQSSEGKIYGLTYVDFTSKCVFNGGDLGKEYSAKGILDQLRQEQKTEVVKLSQEQANGVKQGNAATFQREHKQGWEQNHEKENRQEKESLVELLLKPQQSNDFVPSQLLQKKRKKKQSKGMCR